MTMKEAERLRKRIMQMLALEKTRFEEDDVDSAAPEQQQQDKAPIRRRMGFVKKKQMAELFTDLWMSHLDHMDSDTNNLIQILKKAPDHRSAAELLELVGVCKKVPFFKDHGIVGRDL